MRMLKNKHINLYARYTEKPQSAEKSHRGGSIVPILCVAACLVGFLGMLISSNMTLNARKEELALLRRETEDPLLLDEAARAAEEELQVQMAEQILESVTADMAELTAGHALLESLDPELLNTVTDCGEEIQITGLRWQNTALTIQASAHKAEQIADYISALEQSGAFSSVQYDGYQQQNEAYQFTVCARTDQ